MASVFRPGLFAGRVAIVTGGGTGIGKAITSELAALGCKVVIASRNFDKLKAAAEELKGKLKSDSVFPVACNIRKEDEVVHLMQATVKDHGRLDFLVNNGGGQFPSPAASIKTKGWNAVIETNLTGTFLCCREAHSAWMGQHGGAIVNIIADVKCGFPGMAHTGAARAGVDNITKSLAVEWACNGVRVNAVAPGVIYSDTAAANYSDPAMLTSMVPLIPAKRLGTVEEVSGIVTFLLSPAASYITGTTVAVDGASSLATTTWPLEDHSAMPVYGELPPKAKLRLRAVAAAVSFANRISTASKCRDEKTVEAAAQYLPPRPKHSPKQAPRDFRDRLLQEEQIAKLEDEGVFESRLGLKQRQREAMLSPVGPKRSILSPASSTTSPTSHMSPLPVRRNLGPSPASRASKSSGGYERSPISHERRLEDDEGFLPEEDEIEAQEKPHAPVKRTYSLSEGIAMRATARSTPEKPESLHVKTAVAASRSPKPSSPQVDLKLKALRASEILKSSARGSPSSPSAAAPYFGDSIRLAPPVAPHASLQTPPQAGGVGLLARRNTMDTLRLSEGVSPNTTRSPSNRALSVGDTDMSEGMYDSRPRSRSTLSSGGLPASPGVHAVASPKSPYDPTAAAIGRDMLNAVFK